MFFAQTVQSVTSFFMSALAG